MHYPKHLGIIPDGNRTRAKNAWLPSIIGHQEWFKNFQTIVKYIFDSTEIQVITSRGASTENILERSPTELKYLYKIYKNVTQVMEEIHHTHGVGFKRIGSENHLPTKLIEHFYTQEKKYPSLNGKYAILAVNYWGNDEILRGINHLLESTTHNNTITQKELSDAMDLGDFPLVELIIRTKWKMAKRLSGFMTWRISYAEIYFSDKLFPDLTIEDVKDILSEYDKNYHYRNFGK